MHLSGMHAHSPLILSAGFCLAALTSPAAVSLDGLASNSPFMPKQEISAAPVVTEGATVEFRGLIATKDGVLFGLYDRTRNVGAWVRENDKSSDFTVRSYDATADLLTIDYQGQKFTLPLSTSRIAAASASPTPGVSRPGAPAGGASQPGAVATPQADAARLESVAAEVRRRRALRQAATAGAPTAAPVAAPAPASK